MDEFDAYIAKKSGKGGDEFDDYLASKKGPTKEIPVGVRAPEPEPGFFQRQLTRAADTGKQLLDDIQSESTQEFITHPVDTLTDPYKRRELVRGVADLIPFVPRAANALIGDTAVEDSIRAPGFRGTGNVVGLPLPNPATRLGGAVAGKALGRLPVTGPMSGAGAGLVRGVAGYEAGTVPFAAAEAALDGRDPIEAAKEIGTDPVGLATSAVGGLAGGAARGYEAKLRDPKTLTGRTLENVEREGGKISTFGSRPVKGRIYDAPEVTGSKRGRAGINEVADEAQQRITAHNRGRLETTRDAYGQQADAILAQHAGREYDFSELHHKLGQVEREITASNGVIGDPSLKRALDRIRAMTTQTIAPARPGRPAVTFPAGRVDDLLKAQKIVKARAQYGSISTEENRPYRILDGLLSEEGKDIDPRLRPLKAGYAKTMEELKKANAILYGSAKPDIAGSPAQERQAAARIGRVGDDTQVATGAAERQLDELAQMDPAYDRELRLVRAKKDVERLRYGEPEVSTSIEKGMGRASKAGALRGLAGVLGLQLGGPAGMLAGTAASPLLENPIAARLRLGLPASRAASRLSLSAGGAANPLLRAVQAQRQREEKRAQQLRGR